MGGTTPKGIPYPTGTDRVSDGDNAIEALARHIDGKAPLVGGTVNVTASNAGSGAAAVTFPAGAFSANPAVLGMVNAAISGSASAWYVMASAVTAAGCTINIVQRDGTAASAQLTVGWVAVGA